MTKSWCRLCRIWCDPYHFLLPGGSWGGCGQAREDIRYHPQHPLAGDVWRLKDGRAFVVDYKDSFQTGITFEDGRRQACGYTRTFELFVQDGQLISTFEERPYPACDERGWTRSTDSCTGEESVAFLKEVLACLPEAVSPGRSSPRCGQ